MDKLQWLPVSTLLPKKIACLFLCYDADIFYCYKSKSKEQTVYRWITLLPLLFVISMHIVVDILFNTNNTRKGNLNADKLWLLVQLWILWRDSCNVERQFKVDTYEVSLG